MQRESSSGSGSLAATQPRMDATASAAAAALDVEAALAALASDCPDRSPLAVDRVVATLLVGRGVSAVDVARTIAARVADEAEGMAFVLAFSQGTLDVERDLQAALDHRQPPPPPPQPVVALPEARRPQAIRLLRDRQYREDTDMITTLPT